jgi:uncharacterized membrane protein YcaP (DUF421 family)
MESVLRALAIYAVLMVLFRITGKRSLGQITTFDFILLLIISEAIQNGLVGDSYSITNAFVLVTTLVLVDVGLSLVKGRSPRIERYLDGTPLVIVEGGRLLRDRMGKARVDEGDVLNAARREGLERLAQVKHAVLERNGDISIIPWSQAPGGAPTTERPAA